MTDEDFWRRSLQESAQGIAALLAADARAHTLTAVRAAFVEASVSTSQAAAIKARATAAGDALAAAVRDRLGAIDWLVTPWPADSTPEDLTPLAQSAAQIQEGAAQAVQAAGLEPPASAEPYRLPRRFIDGANLVQLVRSLGKAVIALQALEAERVAGDRAASRTARGQAWDDA